MWIVVQMKQLSKNHTLFLDLITCLSTTDAYGQMQKLVAPLGDGFENDRFGVAVDVWGATAIVGADWDNGAAGSNSGGAYAFKFSDGTWMLQRKLVPSNSTSSDGFGWSVGLHATTAVVSAPSAGPQSQGMAYVFEEIGGSWVETAILNPPDLTSGDVFGHQVSTHEGVIAVGAPHQANHTGAVYVFEKMGEAWEQTSKLLPLAGASSSFGKSVAVFESTILVVQQGLGNAVIYAKSSKWEQVATLSASDGAGFRRASLWGDCALIYGSGRGYVFERSGPEWVSGTETAVLSGSDNPPGFGSSVDMYDEVAFIGASSAAGATSSTGAAYMYVRPPGGWANATEDRKIYAEDGANADNFGSAVAVQGNSFIVGAYWGNDETGMNTGAAYVGKLLAVQDVSPSVGPIAGGNVVFVEGIGFTDSVRVFFGGLPSLETNVLNSTTVQATPPAYLPTIKLLVGGVAALVGGAPVVPATVAVTVKSGDCQATLAGAYTYLP